MKEGGEGKGGRGRGRGRGREGRDGIKKKRGREKKVMNTIEH